ncbi:TPA: hypothetical protein I8Y25_001471 [Raoultella ornithinolytica]|nr:hypothetical protein [Raoultella ornithinolytica]
MRSASPVALRLPGLRGCAVCFYGGAMFTGATGMWGLFPRWRCVSRGYGFVRPASPVALRFPGSQVCTI